MRASSGVFTRFSSALDFTSDKSQLLALLITRPLDNVPTSSPPRRRGEDLNHAPVGANRGTATVWTLIETIKSNQTFPSVILRIAVSSSTGIWTRKLLTQVNIVRYFPCATTSTELDYTAVRLDHILAIRQPSLHVIRAFEMLMIG